MIRVWNHGYRLGLQLRVGIMVSGKGSMILSWDYG